MISTTIFKCILLAKSQLLVIDTPVNEYAMATIVRDHNGVHFEATVVEGKVNSVSIEYLKDSLKSLSFASRDYNQTSLSIMLDRKNDHSSLECELI